MWYVDSFHSPLIHVPLYWNFPDPLPCLESVPPSYLLWPTGSRRYTEPVLSQAKRGLACFCSSSWNPAHSPGEETQASCWKMTGPVVQKQATGQPTPDMCMKPYLIGRLASWPQTHEWAQLNQKNHPTEPSPNSWLTEPWAKQMVVVLNHQILTLFFTQHWITDIGSNIYLI